MTTILEELHFNSMNSAPSATPPVADFIAPLHDRGLLMLTGDDAARFLHSQLTNDVEHLGADEARLAAYCSPKGRMLATFLMWQSADAILLQMPHEILPAIQKRLQMFVLRAKVKLTDASESYVMFGLAGEAATRALASRFPSLPSLPYAKTEAEAGMLIRVADAMDIPRYQWMTTPEVAKSAWQSIVADLQPADSSAWRLGDIRAGVPEIRLETQEKFVPQMVNYELIGGVNFKKGCYPGQEIVARSQYLGKLKRRMMLASIAAAEVKPGMEVFSVADAEQPCGMIVNAERVAENESLCLVEVKTAAVDEGTIHLGSATGVALAFRELPYRLEATA